MDSRPDIIVLLTDQERAPPPYEGRSLQRWRSRVLPGRQWFAEHGVVFERHYTGSLACVPARPTLLTGHYPGVHGVTQTDGIGKPADDPRMRWLRPGEVPTLGHWFRAGGYDSHYDGKWHVSHADLNDPGTGERLATNTDDGSVLPGAVQAYLDADPLGPFGFSGWVGPEPHGARTSDLGIVRDPLTAARVVEWLQARYARRRAGDARARRPFLLVASFVNPHDICIFPAWALRSPLAPSWRDPPSVPPAPTEHQDLAMQPDAQRAYRDAYPTGYGPAWAVERLYRWRAQQYRDLYYRLHAEVDGPIDRVRRAVTEGGSRDAWLVLTADHGELLGAHGGLHQKWFNLFDEATRVPFQVAGIGVCATRAATISDMPTSHVDLLPTLLGAAGLDARDLSAELRRTFSEVHALPGRDLLPVVRGAEPPSPSRAVYLQTCDAVLEGSSSVSLMWHRAGIDDLPLPPSIHVPSHVGSSFEAIVARVPEDEARGDAGHLWKLVRCHDDPATWTEPGVRQRVTSGPARGTFRVRPLPDQWELYDLDADAAEARNLCRDPASASVLDHLRRRLEVERARAVPARNRPWPYAIDGGMPATIELRRSRVLPARREAVWATLADFGGISAWAPNVDASSMIGHGELAVGSVRRVRAGLVRLKEEVVACSPPAELAYRLIGLPPIVRSVVNAWRLEDEGSGTRVTIVTTIEPRAWPGGRLAAGLLGRELRKASVQLLDGLATRHAGG
jgi:arylsulfatase A-like enzyme